MIQDVYIIGATGKVGKTLVNQIYEKGDTNPKSHPNPTRVVGLASKTNTVYSAFGLSRQDSEAFVNRQITPQTEKYKSLFELLNFARIGSRDESSNLVFVDVTPLNEPMSEFHLHVIEQTPYGIVTANKNPIALASYDIFQRLTRDPNRYGYRCSVMAGAHAVPVIQELRGVNDKIRKIVGCFSGTLGYISTRMEKNIPFSEALEDARKQDFTETDPRQDLSGLDVARKLIVIARTLGIPVEFSRDWVEPFIPDSYFHQGGIPHFLSSAKELNPHFEAKMSAARSRGMTLRYVGSLDTTGEQPIVQVSSIEVPKQSFLGGLEGTLNGLIVETDTHPAEKALKFISQGAGPEVTAQNIRVDLNNIMR